MTTTIDFRTALTLNLAILVNAIPELNKSFMEDTDAHKTITVKGCHDFKIMVRKLTRTRYEARIASSDVLMAVALDLIAGELARIEIQCLRNKNGCVGGVLTQMVDPHALGWSKDLVKKYDDWFKLL